jgi:hypothetical protein
MGRREPPLQPLASRYIEAVANSIKRSPVSGCMVSSARTCFQNLNRWTVIIRKRVTVAGWRRFPII